MHPTPLTDPRPEAMADVPGACALPLSRAVIHYRDVHELAPHGGRVQDIGLGLVLEGRFASAARALDLGSADLKSLNLSSELVVLDWVYEPTLEHVLDLIARADAQRSEGAVEAGRSRVELERYAFDLALRVIHRVGYGPLTRPVILRIGFRDICRDLDLHEGTAVRILYRGGRPVRIHLDYDAVALVVRTGLASTDRELEEAVAEAFPGGELRRSSATGPTGSVAYRLRFGLPVTPTEARRLLEAIRFGLGHLLARFEPERYRTVESVLSTFGARETLARLQLREPADTSTRIRSPGSAPGAFLH